MGEFSAFSTYYDGKSNQLKNNVRVFSGEQGIEVSALWDTGATNSCVSKEVVEKLDLKPIGMCEVKTPSGSASVNTYIVDIWLPNQVRIENVKVNGSEIGNQGLGLLIGMDIIGLGDFSVSGANGKTTFSFRIPAQGGTDYYKMAQTGQTITKNRIYPNDPCPCGSDKKYKKCCGK